LGNDLGDGRRDSVVEVDEEAAQGVGQQVGVAENTESPDIRIHAGAIGSSGDETVASNEGGSISAFASSIAALDSSALIFAGEEVSLISAGGAVRDFVVFGVEFAASAVIGEEDASTRVAVVGVEDTVVKAALGDVAARTIRDTDRSTVRVGVAFSSVATISNSHILLERVGFAFVAVLVDAVVEDSRAGSGIIINTERGVASGQSASVNELNHLVVASAVDIDNGGNIRTNSTSQGINGSSSNVVDEQISESIDKLSVSNIFILHGKIGVDNNVRTNARG
jgi:hypothetical protein